MPGRGAPGGGDLSRRRWPGPASTAGRPLCRRPGPSGRLRWLGVPVLRFGPAAPSWAAPPQPVAVLSLAAPCSRITVRPRALGPCATAGSIVVRRGPVDGAVDVPSDGGRSA